jgi:flagellar biosynthesis/type III secretory pathway protein FliH
MRILHSQVNEGTQLAINATQADEAKLAKTLDGIKAQLLAQARQERDAMLAHVHEEAADLRQQAQAAAEQLIADAHQHVEAIQTQAFERGYAEGFDKGHEAGWQELIEGDQSLLVALKQSEKRLFYSIRQDLAQLVQSVCQQVLRGQTAANPQAWLDLMDSAIERCANGKPVTFVLPQALAHSLQPFLPANSPYTLVADAVLKPDQAFIQTPEGLWDMGLDTQIQQLLSHINVQQLLPDDAISPSDLVAD